MGKVEDEDVPQGQQWKQGQANPDHLLARVNAANEGFVSRLDSRYGSMAIHAMFQKYMDALDNGQSPFVHEVFDEVQTELHEAGKQMPECTWNDDTRYLVFKKNKGLLHRVEAIYAKKKRDEAIAAKFVEANKTTTVTEEPASSPRSDIDIVYSPQSIEMTSHQPQESTHL